MTSRLAAALAVAALLAACSGEQPAAELEPTAPTQETVVATPEPDKPIDEPAADPTEEPPRYDDEIDFAERDLEGEPAPDGIISMIEGMSIPDGAVTVDNATMIRHKDVYFIVAAVADTPDGTQILTYLHSPWDQDDIGNGGETKPINFAAQQWAPLASPADDEEAYDIGDRLIVERP